MRGIQRKNLSFTAFGGAHAHWNRQTRRYWPRLREGEDSDGQNNEDVKNKSEGAKKEQGSVIMVVCRHLLILEKIF